LRNKKDGTVFFPVNWYAGFVWDAVGQFKWNASEIIDPITGNTRYLALNPVLGA